MAIIYPDGWSELASTGSATREIETLSLLAKELSDDYRIYHGVHWTRVEKSRQLWGEIDFAILRPSGNLLLIEQKCGFLNDTLNLAPSTSAFVGQAKTLFTRISGGLAEWARKIECEPFRLRIIGTAGSGKTQLALSVFRDSIAAGKLPLYVCYNRPLADHFIQISPHGGMVATYHQLCDKAPVAVQTTGTTVVLPRKTPKHFTFIACSNSKHPRRCSICQAKLRAIA